VNRYHRNVIKVARIQHLWWWRHVRYIEMCVQDATKKHSTTTHRCAATVKCTTKREDHNAAVTNCTTTT